MSFVSVYSRWLWYCAIFYCYNLSWLQLPQSCYSIESVTAMRGRYFLQIAYRSSHHEAALIGILIIVTAPSATSAITVILITLYIVSCWRLYTVLSSSDFTLLHLFLSLMVSCISCLLTRFVHRWTAIFNLSLILCFYTLTPLRYMLNHRYKEVIQWICLFDKDATYE